MAFSKACAFRERRPSRRLEASTGFRLPPRWAALPGKNACAAGNEIQATLLSAVRCDSSSAVPRNPFMKPSRRGFIKTASAGALASTLESARAESATGSAARSNRVIAENAKEGSLDWQLTRVRLDG